MSVKQKILEMDNKKFAKTIFAMFVHGLYFLVIFTWLDIIIEAYLFGNGSILLHFNGSNELIAEVWFFIALLIGNGIMVILKLLHKW